MASISTSWGTPALEICCPAPKDVQEILGHADVSTTMNIYPHATREAPHNVGETPFMDELLLKLLNL
ncbi:MAG: hypothetical protein H6Q69_3645 [Firmicutes bacterium]|nr:hypothetical protein [Bacillota bacterium]